METSNTSRLSFTLAPFIILWLLPVTVRCCSNGKCFIISIPQNETMDNHVLSDFLIKNVTNVPDIGCHAVCSLKCGCLSYSEAKDKSHCLLYYESNLTAPWTLKFQEGYKYVNIFMETEKECESSDKECMNFCCLGKPCLWGAQCKELCDHPRKQFNCTCPEGFTGSKCQISLECTSNPCMNGGTCTEDNKLKRYNCSCPEGYIGTHCEKDCGPAVMTYITADDALEVYGDENFLASHSNWQTAINVVFPNCTKIVGLIGIDNGVAKGIFGSFSNGIVTNGSWKCSSQFNPDWLMYDFDDSSWLYAQEASNIVWNLRHLKVISREAKWIWTHDDSGRIYCRKKLI